MNIHIASSVQFQTKLYQKDFSKCDKIVAQIYQSTPYEN